MRKYIFVFAAALAIASQSVSAEISDRARARGYHESESKKTITFVFDNALWKAGSVSSVDVRGSFNNWSKSSDFVMSYDNAESCWTVTLPVSQVRIPGNSGQPEYKFVVNGSNWLSGYGRSFIPEGYVFMTSDRNNIVVFHDDDFDQIKENSRMANTVKTVSDYDLTTREGKEEISNFRLVPGTLHLFRCYHPFKWSREKFDTEPVRIATVQELSVEEGIKSDICLSGNDTKSLTSYTVNGKQYQESVPAYYQEIIDGGNVLYVGTANGHTPSYNEVYYNSTGERLGQWVKETVDFINQSPAPFSIHCRLGTDRTGVFCGILAALCGASWQEIAADYQLTNRMCIQEFRDYHLLQYSFQKMLGVESISEVEDVTQALSAYFTGNGILTDDDIEGLRHKLGSALSSGVALNEAEAVDAPAEYYNLQGVRVEHPSNGIYICRRGSSVTKVIK